MRIRKSKKKEAILISELIYRTFKKFNSKDVFDVNEFNQMLGLFDTKRRPPKDIYHLINSYPISFTAEVKQKIVGIIYGYTDRLITLMLDGQFHGRRIGAQMVERFEKEVKRRKANPVIKIKSSLYAVKFYEKMGYRKTTGIRNFNGSMIFNMKKTL